MPWWKVIGIGFVILVMVYFIRDAIDGGGLDDIKGRVPSVNINP